MRFVVITAAVSNHQPGTWQSMSAVLGVLLGPVINSAAILCHLATWTEEPDRSSPASQDASGLRDLLAAWHIPLAPVSWYLISGVLPCKGVVARDVVFLAGSVILEEVGTDMALRWSQRLLQCCKSVCLVGLLAS